MSDDFTYIDADGWHVAVTATHIECDVSRPGLPDWRHERAAMARKLLEGTGYTITDHDPLGLVTDSPPDLQTGADDEPGDEKPSAADRLSDLEMSSGVHGRAALALFRRTDALAHRLSDLETTVNHRSEEASADAP